MAKNNSIEFFRFFFICVICLWHFSGFATFIQHGYIAVEFFFIMSGYFLFRSFEKHSEIGVLDYTLHRVKKFFVPFLISFVLLLLLDRKQYIYLPSEITPDTILEKYFVHIHELFFCQGLSLTERVSVNHPLWFLSILLFSGAVLYSILQYYRHKAISLIIPVLVMLGYNYLLMNGSHSLAPFCSSFLPGLNTGIVRGIADMGLGILVACLYEKKQAFFIQYKWLVSIGGGFALIGFVLMVLANGNYDYLALFFAPLILLCCNVAGALFQRTLNCRINGWLGGLSMYMYFIHLFVANLFWISSSYIHSFPNYIIVGLYLLLVIISAHILKISSNKISSIVNLR